MFTSRNTGTIETGVEVPQFNFVRKLLRGFFGCSLGGIAISVAVGAPVLMGAVGLASDFAVFTLKKSELQSAADAAALAATRELSVISTDSTSAKMSSESEEDEGPIEEIARNYVMASLETESTDISTSVEIDEAEGSVRVSVTDTWQPFFAHFLGADITPITTDAKAQLVGENKVCVIGLAGTGSGVVSLTNDAHLEAKGCSVYSNSTNSMGFYLGSGSEIEADLVCSAGGVYNKGASSSAKVLTDCPPLADPLSGRSPPAFGGCSYTNTMIGSGIVTLKPGVYCGGINISGDAQVTFAAGDYIIKDGLFFVHGKASVKGANVGFYFTGLLSLIQFWDDASIDLSGREDGDMAGLLFFDDPKASILRVHNIRSTRAKNLTGTVYLPKGTLLVDPAASVAEKSAYTAIIARRLVIENGPSLVLNTNYGATKVPVPSGIRSSADVVLAE